jgi:hypothetical protein
VFQIVTCAPRERTSVPARRPAAALMAPRRVPSRRPGASFDSRVCCVSHFVQLTMAGLGVRSPSLLERPRSEMPDSHSDRVKARDRTLVDHVGDVMWVDSIARRAALWKGGVPEGATVVRCSQRSHPSRSACSPSVSHT